MSTGNTHSDDTRAAANRRLAVILGLVAFGIFLSYILLNFRG